MRQGERTDLERSANLPKVSVAQSAQMLNVSERTVASARRVVDHGAPELVHAVEAGQVSDSAGSAAVGARRRSGAQCKPRWPEAIDLGIVLGRAAIAKTRHYVPAARKGLAHGDHRAAGLAFESDRADHAHAGD